MHGFGDGAFEERGDDRDEFVVNERDGIDEGLVLGRGP